MSDDYDWQRATIPGTVDHAEAGVSRATRRIAELESIVRSQSAMLQELATAAGFKVCDTFSVQALIQGIKHMPGVIKRLPTARLRSEYHEDMGPVLWWKFPIEEPPYCGGPNDCGHTVEMRHYENGKIKTVRTDVGGWPGYHTHFTLIDVPEMS